MMTKQKKEFITIYFNSEISQINFSVNDIKQSLSKQNITIREAALDDLSMKTRKIIIGMKNSKQIISFWHKINKDPIPDLKDQGYLIRTLENDSYVIIGADAAGTMYGAVRLSRHIMSHGLNKALNEQKEPYLKKRGIKINIPLDARTPSYDSDGDSANTNIRHMWDLSFWIEHIDELARNRYNVISFWNSHPFTSMCIVPDFPETALNDIYDYDGLVKKISIQEKIIFWKKVFQHAKNRGMDIFWFNWNVYAYGAAGKYGIDESVDNEITKEYSRKSLYAFLKTYEDIDAFGISAGEHFSGLKPKEREKWLRETWGEALQLFKKDFPERRIFFIHRFLMTGMDPIMEEFNDLGLPMDISFKYSVGHMYAYHKPAYIFEKGVMEGLKKHKLKTWLNIRNDDIYYFHWCDPDYAKAYLTNFPEKDKYIAGYYMGSDGYVWGRTFSYSKNYEKLNGTQEIHKHWLTFRLWGELGYDPHIPDQYFIEQIQYQYPETNAKLLFRAWKTASKIIPTVNSAINRDNDAQWYVEGCLSKNGFVDINTIIERFRPQPGAPICSIKQYKEQLESEKEIEWETPLDITGKLEKYALESLQILDQIKVSNNTGLKLLLTDIKAMCLLGLYYSEKISGAVYHHLGNKDQAVRHLESAYGHWKNYAETASEQYIDQYTARHNPGGKNSGIKENKFSFKGTLLKVEEDIKIAIR